jgi:DNA-binding response OmpR family regulator
VARILVVEDEPNIAGIIDFKLRREGHQVVCVPGAELASTAVSGLQPDAIVLDASAGDVRGILAGPGARCPVLVLTDLHDEEAPRRALRDGAAATLRMPFKPTVLARTITRLLGST